MSFCYKVISITWLSSAHTPLHYYRFYIFQFLFYEVSCLVSLKSRLGLEAMMSRLGLEALMSRLGRFGPRSSSGFDYNVNSLTTSHFGWSRQTVAARGHKKRVLQATNFDKPA